MSGRGLSLQRRLIIQLLILQFLTIAVCAVVLVAALIHTTADGMYSDDKLVKVAARAITRDQHGAPILRMTPDLTKLRGDIPDLWFVAKLDSGEQVTLGNVPRELAAIAGHLEKFSSADLRGRDEPYAYSAVIRPEKGPAGAMTIIAHGKVRPFTFLIAIASNLLFASLFVVLAIVAIVAIPWIVRRALTGVRRAARDAERITIQRRGLRLSEDGVPREVNPLVHAVNAALDRLDEGYERQGRFIASAAHELRTPIAILRMKIETSREPSVSALTADVLRLGNMSEQLLDLHRLENDAPDERLDLAALARRVVADLAPFLIAANKSIAVIVESVKPVNGSAPALERVLINLVQNAVEHGGADVIVRVDGSAFEVEDNGDGIPLDERDRVFDPFHRLRPRSSGTGLGLNLVRQVVDHHRGRVTILDAPGGGTIIRVSLPPAD